MHRLIESMTTREILIEQIPTLAASIIIAELLYKFHSFTLEALAFLATWYVLDMAMSPVFELISSNKENSSTRK